MSQHRPISATVSQRGASLPTCVQTGKPHRKSGDLRHAQRQTSPSLRKGWIATLREQDGVGERPAPRPAMPPQHLPRQATGLPPLPQGRGSCNAAASAAQQRNYIALCRVCVATALCAVPSHCPKHGAQRRGYSCSSVAVQRMRGIAGGHCWASSDTAPERQQPTSNVQLLSRVRALAQGTSAKLHGQKKDAQ